MTLSVHVTSEIGRLRSVLVHEPGREVDLMVPAMMHELLFDDILYGEKAREEHRLFMRLLQLFGIETLDAERLLEEALDVPEARSWIMEVVLADLPKKLLDPMREISSKDLAALLASGIRMDSMLPGIEADQLFQLPPIPNWCFQRDPQVVMGDGVVFCAMSAAARQREAFLARATFRFHPRFAGVPVFHDPLVTGEERPRLEGGDVLVLSSEIVAVGESQRTGREAILDLARSLAGAQTGPRWLVIVALPERRAYMHLDTVFTQVDRGACLVYPPVVSAGGADPARIFEIDLRSGDFEPKARKDLLGTLRERGLELEPIPCGGKDPLVQQREQWTDGANALALAPGVIAMYERNVGTAEELSKRGYSIVRAEDVLLGRTRLRLENPGKTCILLPSHEISRARGGPHCLTHPLVREEV